MGFRGRKIRTTSSLHYDVIVVMKGAPTHIIKSVNTGNAALATAGSGMF
jgi:NAD(P)H-hydrate repair Nnr-like enzyme with NAD(P)H-hydrate dehydratase domain